MHKLTREQKEQKLKLDNFVTTLGFHRTLEITDLKGTSLGQYLDLQVQRCLPHSKFKLLEYEVCLMKSKGLLGD